VTTDDIDSFDLHKVFAGQEDGLRAQLKTGKQAGHPGVQGDGTEDGWLKLLQDRLPHRYAVTRGIVVDSKGSRSHQIDLVVHDRHFSPQFWEYGGHHYVPAESVYAVFEIKPKLTRKNVLYAGKKVATVRALHRTSASFGWAMGPMPARALFPILGGILADDCKWSPPFGEPFATALQDVGTDGRLDLGCVLGKGAFEVQHDAPADQAVVSGADTALVTFLLTLLHRLQGLGSAPAIDYPAYAQWIAGRAGAAS
jgi:hypothetical protein